MPPRCFVGVGGIVVGIVGLSVGVAFFLGLGLGLVAFFLFLMSACSRARVAVFCESCNFGFNLLKFRLNF